MKITNELIIAFMMAGSESDVTERVESLLSEFASDPDIPPEWVDEALRIAQNKLKI